MKTKHIIAAIMSMLPTMGSASETVTYDYDSKGRLIQVAHSGGPMNGMVSYYSFDAADNRTSANMSMTQPRTLVVPLGGMKVITVR